MKLLLTEQGKAKCIRESQTSGRNFIRLASGNLPIFYDDFEVMSLFYRRLFLFF